MSASNHLDAPNLRVNIAERDVGALADRLTALQFVLIHIEEPSDEDDAGLGALTADVSGQPFLVAFSSQEHATEFVNKRSDVFNSDDEVGGFLVDGSTVLDYLDDEYGLLINPETDDSCLIDSELIADILDELGMEDQPS